MLLFYAGMFCGVLLGVSFSSPYVRMLFALIPNDKTDEYGSLTLGHVTKGGHNPPYDGSPRPPAPRGSGRKFPWLTILLSVMVLYIGCEASVRVHTQPTAAVIEADPELANSEPVGESVSLETVQETAGKAWEQPSNHYLGRRVSWRVRNLQVAYYEVGKDLNIFGSCPVLEKALDGEFIVQGYISDVSDYNKDVSVSDATIMPYVPPEKVKQK